MQTAPCCCCHQLVLLGRCAALSARHRRDRDEGGFDGSSRTDPQAPAHRAETDGRGLPADITRRVSSQRTDMQPTMFESRGQPKGGLLDWSPHPEPQPNLTQHTNGRREPYRTGTVLAQGQRGGAQICRYEDAEHGHCHRRHPPANVAASGSAASHSPAGRLYWEISRGFSTFQDLIIY